MEGAPVMKSVLRFLLVLLVLILPCLTFAEEPDPTADTIAAEPHYSLRVLDVIPNDLYFPSQWNLAKIEAPAAWEITTGGDEIAIAVIGTGVDLDHAELRNKIWTNPGEIPGNGIDDDGNGYVDDVHGWDFVNQDGEPQDDHGHGTFVATVAAAETNNGLEIAGMSWGAETVPILVGATPLAFGINLGSLDSVTVTKNTANGIATPTWPAQVPGRAMITATSDSEVATTAVEVEPGLPYTVTLVAYPTSLAVGDTSTLTATVKDQDNNDVADGTVVTFETSLGSLGSTPVTKTIVTGVATAELTSQIVGTAVVTATSDSKYDTANVIFNPSPPYTLTVEAYPTRIAVRGFTSTITAILKDQHDNPVADGTVVTLTTDLGSLGLDSSSLVKTTVNGVATATLKSGAIDGTANVYAASDSVVGQTEVIFMWDGGIAGVSWGAQIMPIKVLPGGVISVSAGIKYAADNGARIILLAFKLTGYDAEMEAQIAEAYDKGALLVAGAGNCGMGGEHCEGINPIVYPGAFPHVLAVAATSQTDKHMSFSEYHPYVDIAAPGERIPGFWLYEYRLLPDTWFAAAHVAGLAALTWSVDPTLTNDEVEGIIERTAVDQVGDPAKDTPGWDEYFGHGRIDAHAAVMAALCYPQVEPDSLYFSVCNHSNPPSQTITSTKHCMWSTGETAPWLSVSPSEGYTTTVSIDIGSLSGYDVYTATITATSTLTNCVNYPQTIPVTVKYEQRWRNYLPLLFKNHTSH
jgi:subtilisin family serine protease